MTAPESEGPRQSGSCRRCRGKRRRRADPHPGSALPHRRNHLHGDRGVLDGGKGVLGGVLGTIVVIGFFAGGQIIVAGCSAATPHLA